MAEATKISWADHSWSPWRVCTKVSDGCDNCYAEVLARRAGLGWGHGEPRRRTSVAYWRKPLAWNAAAEAAGERRRVFPSLCDPFDAEVPAEWRADLFALVEATPRLDWLLLTKRPNLVAKHLVAAGRSRLPGNVWLGTSVEDQERGWRAERLAEERLEVNAQVAFLSIEPMLGPVDLSRLEAGDDWSARNVLDNRGIGIDWVIVGAESGPKRRPFENAWALAVVAQCDAAGVPVWCKQGPGLRSEAPFGDARLDGRRELPRLAVRA